MSRLTLAFLLGLGLIVAPALADTRHKSTLSADDLRSIEARVIDLLPKLQAATVAVMLPRGGAGTGIIVNEKGLILTAGHVSGEPGAPAEVILHDGRRLRGKALGRNGVEDAGMIQILNADDQKFDFIAPGKSSTLEPGQWVIALGHPGGWNKERPAVLRLGRVIRQNLFIQTDAVLVGGDSGGPLFDLDGHLVGIHSRIGTSIADNRHVPIDKFTAAWDRLARGDDWNPANQPMAWLRNQPWLGIEAGQDDPAGHRVRAVDEAGPAFRAGIQAGDVIVAFAGKPIGNESTTRTLITLIGTCRIGDIVDVELLRDGETVRLPVKLSRRPDASP